MVVETAQQCFAKLGNSPFVMGDLRIDNPEQLFVPTSLLNELRRLAVATAEEALASNQQNTARHISQELQQWRPDALPEKLAQPTWSVKIDQPFFLNLFAEKDWQNLQVVIFDLGKISEKDLPAALASLEQKVGRNRLCLALPAITRPLRQRNWPALVKTLFKDGWRRWQISNLGSLAMLSEAGASKSNAWFSADWPLYVSNKAAARGWQELGLKRLTLTPDDSLENWTALLSELAPCLEVVAYSDLPLAISAVCADASRLGLCPGRASCNFTEMALISRKNERLLAINNDCQTVYINEQPFNLAGKLAKLQQQGVQHFRADFLWRNYAPAQVKAIWDSLQADQPSPQAWTANLFTNP